MAKTKVGLSPQEQSEKWARRTKAAVPDMQEGIRRLEENPLDKAAAKQDKMIANLTKSVQNGTWAKGLKGYGFEKWKEVTAQKGGERISGGIDQAMDKHTKFAEYNTRVINEGLSKIKDMPDMTIDDSANRAVAFMKYMASKPYKENRS